MVDAVITSALDDEHAMQVYPYNHPNDSIEHLRDLYAVRSGANTREAKR